jgi:hypothetical protein
MGYSRFLIPILLAVLLASCDGCSGKVEEWQTRREAAKQKELKALKEIAVPLRFRVLERSAGKIQVELQFYALLMDDIDKTDMEYRIAQSGDPIAAQLFELEGEEVFIDFLKYHEQEKLFAHPVYWIFPYRIFTDHIAPDKGIRIDDYYNNGGFPAIYNNCNLEPDKRQTLIQHFADIKQYGNLEDNKLQKQISGNAVHDMQQVSRFRVGRWYDVAVHIKSGTVEFIAE